MQLNILNNYSTTINTNFNGKKHTPNKPTTQELKEEFKVFETKVMEQSRQHKTNNKVGFSREFTRIYQDFLKIRNLETLNGYCTRLAERLVSVGNNDFAGIIYSRLLKLNPKNSRIVETCANNSKKIAHRMQDWIHCIARCFDLRNIYRNNPNKQNEYKKNLLETKNYLTKICSQYTKAKQHYKSVNRPIQDKNVYEKMLASILCEIAELEKDNNPQNARVNLDKAITIFDKLGHTQQKENALKLLKQLIKK